MTNEMISEANDANDDLSVSSDAVDMTCTCGARLSFERSAEHISCQCGASYAVTITQLTPPDDANL